MRTSTLCIVLTSAVTGCTIGPGGVCGPNIPAIYCASKEERDRAFHPKAYGEFWVKPGMTKEGWRADWLACGGMRDGGYSSDAPSGSSSEVLLEASRRKARQLDACMQARGYSFSRTR